MTVTSKVLVQGKRIENSQTTQYTSTNCKTIVDGALITNTTAGAETVAMWLVPSGGAAADANLVADDVSVPAGGTYLCPELAGRRLDAGDFLVMQASASNSLSLRVDGRQVTS